MTHTTRTTRSLITLACAVLFGLSLSAQAQGLKTNSGSFGSGWQVGGNTGDSAGGYGSTGSSGGSGSAGSPASSYGGYSGSYSGSASSTGTTGSASSAYGGYSSTYGGAYGSGSAPAISASPSTTTDTPYSAPRSAGGGLRAQ